MRVDKQLRAMKIKATSPDKRVLGTLQRRHQTELFFADEEAYDEYTDVNALAYQMQEVLRRLTSAYREGRQTVLSQVPGWQPEDQSHWDAKRRRFQSERDGIFAQGVSPGRFVQIEAIGLHDWTVVVLAAALSELNAEAFRFEANTALKALREDHAAELCLLKEEVYDNVGMPTPEKRKQRA